MRAAELCMVAYDTNAQDSQFLQGFLIRQFQNARSTGKPHEFLWANPISPD